MGVRLPVEMDPPRYGVSSFAGRGCASVGEKEEKQEVKKKHEERRRERRERRKKEDRKQVVLDKTYWNKI